MHEIINRRKWMGTLALGVLSACSRRRSTGFNGYALVANAGDHSLAAIDLAAFQLTRTIELPSAPSRLVCATFGRSYALLPQTGTICGVGSNLKLFQTRRLADHVSDLRLSVRGDSLLAVAPHGNQLIEADLATLKPIARHAFSLRADRVDVSPQGLAAAAAASGGVELLDLRSGRRTQVETPPLGDIRFRKDGQLLLAANLQNRSLLAFDVPTLKTVAELPLAMRPDHLCFNSDEGQLFISGEGMDGVAVVFPFNTLVDQTILAGRNPGTMACSATPAYLFVASETGSDLCILNIGTRKVIGFVETGGRPSFILVTPDSQYALVLDQEAGDMAVIRIPTRLTGEERRLKTGTSLFTMISVGSRPVHAVVVARSA